MTGARRVWFVIRREWDQRVRSNSFRISTLVAAAIIVAIIAVPGILGGDTKQARSVGVVGVTSTRVAEAMAAAGEQLGFTITTRSFDDRAAAEDALQSEDVNVLLVDQRELVWRSAADDQLGAIVTIAVQAVEQQHAIESLDLTHEQLRSLQPSTITSVSLEPGADERSARLDLAMIGVGVMLLTISFYGGFLLVGVIEEKSSRTIEVLLSRLRPTELLSGKIVGIGLVGLAQVGLVAVAALVALAVTHNSQIPTTAGPTIAWLVPWFVLGYGFYAVLYGAAGSLVSRQEEAQSMTFPITAILFVAYFFAMEAARSPDSMAALIGSFVPPTAPLVMVVRIAHGGLPWWQIALSVLLTVGTIYAMIRVAGRVYAGAALRMGRRVKLMDAWRAAELTG
jgi:ABC-2 type transport system permease protein